MPHPLDPALARLVAAGLIQAAGPDLEYLFRHALIQDAAYGALQGQTQPDAALQALQAKLQTLIK